MADDRRIALQEASKMNPCRPLSASATLALAIGATGLALFAGSPACAQDMPHVDAVGAYNHANVMTRPRTADKDAAGPEPEAENPRQTSVARNEAGGTISQRHLDRIVSDLRVEYHDRVARDGKASADAWLARSVDALKRRYTAVED